jgi:hypothetical protein
MFHRLSLSIAGHLSASAIWATAMTAAMAQSISSTSELLLKTWRCYRLASLFWNRHICIDVKAMGRTTDVALNYVNNIVASQMRLDAAAFLFTSYNTNESRLTVCGWLPKPFVTSRGNFFKKGTIRTRRDSTTFECKADMWEVPNSKICHKAQNWAELWAEMSVWAQARKILAIEEETEVVDTFQNS